METWPVQSGVVGWSACFQSRVGRGWILEHAECHAKELKLYLWTMEMGMVGSEAGE